MVTKLAGAGYPAAEARRLGSIMQILIEGAIVATRTRGEPSALAAAAALIPILLHA
jgi:hypothetical protein